MGLKVLIIECHNVLRAGLRTIFEEDARVSDVQEANQENDLRPHLHRNELDLVIINQTLITDMSILSRVPFVVLSNKPDIGHLKNAYKYGARGYLSVNATSELLLAMLRPMENSFLIEPTLIPMIIDQYIDNSSFSVKDELLTPREREIIRLLQEGHDKPSIIRQLGIAETTLKTHMKNISKKCDPAPLLLKKRRSL